MRLRGRQARGAAVIAALALPGAFVGAFVWAARVPFDRAALDYADVASAQVLARDGTPLRTTLGGARTRAMWTPLARISPLLVEATLAAEDRRFRAHPGVDPAGVARAAWRNLRAGEVTAGGSTLTQQLAGLLWPEPRTPAGKLREAVRAVRLEIALSKDGILEQYLNRAPYGSMIQGVRAASESYFEMDPERIGPAQAATLAALPKAPGRFVSASGADALRRRRDHILAAMERRGVLSAEESAVARRAPLDLRQAAGAHRAPHFADWVLAERPSSARAATRLTTTLDAHMQGEIEAVARAARARLVQDGGATQIGVVVQALPSREVLAMVGSTDWADPAEGQVNAALAPRQPGSALKPFLYAMAFDGGRTAADLLADTPMEAVDAAGASLSPRNFDGRFRGPVRMRVALASSFNVPAVRLQERMGTPVVLEGLRAAGLDAFSFGAEHYGLGLTLGVGEVTLLDLTNAYAGLACGGLALPPVFLLEAADARGRALPLARAGGVRWCEETSAFLVQDILADDAARVPGFGGASAMDLPFPVVVKTGTSTGYRDAWCVGFDRDHVVGVWTGNFDGTPARGAAGVRGAGPLFREIMLLLHDAGSRPWSADPPHGWRQHPICALSGERPGAACAGTALEWFADDAWAVRAACAFHGFDRERRVVDWPGEYLAWAVDAGILDGDARRVDEGGSRESWAGAAGREAMAGAPRITSPADGSVYYLDPSLGDAAAIRVRAVNAGPRARWTLDGRTIGALASRDARAAAAGGSGFLWPPVPGEHVIEIEGPEGRDEVRFSVR